MIYKSFSIHSPAARIFLLLFSCCLLSCKTQSNSSSTKAGIQFNFPSEQESQDLITSDQKEHFFESINPLDIQIQMGKENNNPDLNTYKDFLISDVSTFSNAEQSRMQKLLDEINNSFSSQSIKPSINNINIVKTNGYTYGKQAFFTREKTIFIPEGQLNMSDRGLRSVLLHEIFHIISRYDSTIKSKAYELIGFVPLKMPIKVSSELQTRVLLNPDGLDQSYGIRLKTASGSTTMAVPLIRSKHKAFKSTIPNFFDYIEFDLYELDTFTYQVRYKEDLSNTISDEYFNNFFEQISDNTQYIIHPDEIMADNFMLMINAYSEDKFDHFSESGKRIINNLHQIFSRE